VATTSLPDQGKWFAAAKATVFSNWPSSDEPEPDNPEKPHMRSQRLAIERPADELAPHWRQPASASRTGLAS
jgi:hypothetical protein